MTSFKVKPNTTKGNRVCSKRTICEIHRQIYDELVIGLKITNPELLNRVAPLLEEAFGIGIKMTKKLLDYKCSLPNWERNTNRVEIRRVRNLRLKLENEKNLA